MKKYYVERHRTEVTSLNPKPLTAAEVENFANDGTSYYDPEVTEFDSFEEAKAYADDQQPSSYWESSFGKIYLLQVEYYELCEAELDDETGEADFIDITARYFAAAEF